MLEERDEQLDGGAYPEGRGLQPLARDPVEELLESRLVARDFEVEGGTVRVETRIRLSRNPWSVSSVVFENGVEVQEGPYAPLHDEVDTTTFDPDALDELRRELAARVLEIHGSRCRQVERALGGRPASARSSTKTAGVVLALMLVLVAVGGTGYYLWSQKTSTAVSPQETEGLRESPPDDGAGSAAGAGATGGDTTQSTLSPSDSGLAPPSFDPVPEIPGAPASPRARQDRVQPDARARAAAPAASRRPAPPSPPPAAPPEEPSEAATLDTALGPSTADEVSPREFELQVSTLITQLRPPHYRLGSLSPGAFAFSDDDAVFTTAPQAQLSLPCIRPSTKDSAAEGVNVSFLLESPARVFVGHDARIRKKPEWLSSFTPAGQRWEVDGVGTSEETVTYEVFMKSFSAGMVRLGPNIQWTGLTRRWRDTFPKNLAMYLVCVETD